MTKEQVAVDAYGVAPEYQGGEPGIFSRILKRLEVSTYEKGMQSNADLDPVPPEKRTWNYWHCMTFSIVWY